MTNLVTRILSTRTTEFWHFSVDDFTALNVASCGSRLRPCGRFFLRFRQPCHHLNYERTIVDNTFGNHDELATGRDDRAIERVWLVVVNRFGVLE